jgi:hypothetical protein
MDVGEKERHRPARGDIEGFVEVLPGAVGIAIERAQHRAGEQAAGEVLQPAGAAESLDGGS